MTRVARRNESGDVITVDVLSRNVQFVYGDNEIYTPTLVNDVQYDNKSKSSQTTTVCGETENNYEGENKPTITVEGIVPSDESNTLRNLRNADDLTVSTEVEQGSYYVKRLSMGQSSDTPYIIMDGERSIAISYQLQLEKE